MKKAILVIAVIVISYPVSSSALAGLSIGGKVGVTNYSGDVLPASGDIGSTVMYGGVLEITSTPVLDFELHANYSQKDFTYAYTVAGNTVSTDFQFQDFSILLTAKKNLITVPTSPIALYIGGGVGWHLLSTEIARNVASGTVDPSQAGISLFSNNAKMSGHGLVGLKLSPPVFPLAIYGQARFGRIFTDEALTTTQVEGGVLLRF